MKELEDQLKAITDEYGEKTADLVIAIATLASNAEMTTNKTSLT